MLLADKLAAYAQSLRYLNAAAAGTATGHTHPFALELAALQYEPWQVVANDPIPPKPLEDTPFTYVDTAAALEDMVSQLKGCRHIAVDLEAHSYRCVSLANCPTPSAALQAVTSAACSHAPMLHRWC